VPPKVFTVRYSDSRFASSSVSLWPPITVHFLKGCTQIFQLMMDPRNRAANLLKLNEHQKQQRDTGDTEDLKNQHFSPLLWLV